MTRNARTVGSLEPLVLRERLASLIAHRFGRAMKTSPGLPATLPSDALPALGAFTWLTLAHADPRLPIAMGIRGHAPLASSRRSPRYEVMDLHPHARPRVALWRLDARHGWTEMQAEPEKN